jgi:hypothetical protein
MANIIIDKTGTKMNRSASKDVFRTNSGKVSTKLILLSTDSK